MFHGMHAIADGMNPMFHGMHATADGMNPMIDGMNPMIGHFHTTR